MKLALSIDSPIYDIRMKIGEDEPNNADGWFWWLTTIRQALAGSRNIPAIKMFFSVGGENAVKSFLSSLGIRDLEGWAKFYGYPLSIWASEMKMIDLTNAYMHLSALGKPAKINPILEIRWPDNSLLYKKEVALQEQVIPTGVAYLIWKILSDNSNLPADWVRQFTAPWKLVMATKSGTTNIVKGEEKLPRDGWLMTYTPSKVIWLWWGNTDGSAMYKDAYWGWLNSGIRKSFITKLQESGYIQNEAVTATETKEVVISKLSWKLASAETPLAFTQKSLAYLQTAPTEYDAGASKIDIDMLCNWTPSELTPPQDLSSAYFIRPETIMPDQRDQSDIQNRRQTVGIEKYKESVWPILLTQLTGSCAEQRQWLTSLGDISLNIIKPLPGEKITRNFSLRHQTTSSHTIKTVKVFLGTQELNLLNYRKTWWLNDISTISVPESIAPWTHELKLIVIDDKWYSDTKSIQVTLIDADTTPPYLMDTKVQIEQQADGTYKIALLFADESSTLREWTIEQNGTTIHSFKDNIAQFVVNNLDNQLSRVALDSANNKWTWVIDLKRYKVKTTNNTWSLATWSN
jgi:membrane carboxypeptidase/penicillin-binding protein PbpC